LQLQNEWEKLGRARDQLRSTACRPGSPRMD
jgi:hypothetical protein